MPERVRTNTQAVLRLAWGGLAKGNQSCNKPKQVSFLERKSIKARAWSPDFQGLGPRAWGREQGARVWGRGLQGFGAGASQHFGARVFKSCHENVLKKSLGGKQAKGWETAETAAAEVGAWREAGTGYPPYPPPPYTPPPSITSRPTFLGCKGEKKRVFTLSVTETIQHALQGRRTFLKPIQTLPILRGAQNFCIPLQTCENVKKRDNSGDNAPHVRQCFTLVDHISDVFKFVAQFVNPCFQDSCRKPAP